MKKSIAVIGTGNMGSAIAKALANAGHEIYIAGKDAQAAETLAQTIRAGQADARVQAVDTAAAVQHAEIIIPAVWYATYAGLAEEIRSRVAGKIVVSIANPLNETFDGLVTAADTSAAEELAELLPEATIVKAFNTTFAADFTTPRIGGQQVDCFVAGDDEQALQTVSDLVADAGFRPLNAGPLSMSRTLESMMVLLIGLAMRYDYNWLAGWKVLSQA